MILALNRSNDTGPEEKRKRTLEEVWMRQMDPQTPKGLLGKLHSRKLPPPPKLTTITITHQQVELEKRILLQELEASLLKADGQIMERNESVGVLNDLYVKVNRTPGNNAFITDVLISSSLLNNSKMIHDLGGRATAQKLLKEAFPYSYRRIHTSGQGFLCGPRAIVASMKAQGFRIDQYPTVKQLTMMCQHPKIRAFEEELGELGRDNRNNFFVDQLASMLAHWGSDNGLELQLGYVIPNGKAFLVSCNVTPATRVVWIHSDSPNGVDDDPEVVRHYEGLRPRAAEEYLQDANNQAKQESWAKLGKLHESALLEILTDERPDLLNGGTLADDGVLDGVLEALTEDPGFFYAVEEQFAGLLVDGLSKGELSEEKEIAHMGDITTWLRELHGDLAGARNSA
ncbi:hypothetical protein B0T19DRAFT_479225 [Cercophora scortea]|uniref:Uncharacterized protein n=1 Tax=Cercophora scortea TaxID=314031 RepID=A0AAE0M6F4_9PEZI|nr:hypothetical protein B0T19DRAFT_479225 [Cercophora scortea]